MDLKKIISNMTREEFLELGLIERGCPWHWGIDYKCKNEICTDCWLNSLEKSGIKFKDEKTEEEKVVEGVKLIKQTCEKYPHCVDGCPLYLKFDKECVMSELNPCEWELEKLEGLNESKS